MSELTIKGTIKTVLDVQSGIAKTSGNEWKKLTFVVANDEGYEGKEQIFAFEIFGEEKVENFQKYNKPGQKVEVSFNIGTNEYNSKYYTSLSAWKVMAESANDAPLTTETKKDDLPF